MSTNFEPLRLTAREYFELLEDPNVHEVVSARLLFVDASEGTPPRIDEARTLQHFSTLPAVVVSLHESAEQPASAILGAHSDVIVAESDVNLSALNSVVQRCPNAAISLSVLLRQQYATIESVLVAESATYALLQGGQEFAAWRAKRPIATGSNERAQVVKTERVDHIFTITLDRPEIHNAFNMQMRDELAEALTLAATDREILRVQINATGSSFCSGGDLNEFGQRPDTTSAHIIRLTRSPARLMHEVGVKVEVHVHGWCLGAGIELPAFAKRIVAHPDAKLGLPEVSFGLIPGAGGTASVRQRIGRHRTAYLALTATPIDTTTALEWGLIDEIQSRPTPW
jgi:enoyl-CoA hydratase/carnithine racemase